MLIPPLFTGAKTVILLGAGRENRTLVSCLGRKPLIVSVTKEEALASLIKHTKIKAAKMFLYLMGFFLEYVH